MSAYHVGYIMVSAFVADDAIPCFRENNMLKHSVVMGIMVLFLAACSVNPQEKGTIVFNNNSDYLLSDVKVKYTNNKRVDVLGDLPAHTSYTYKIHYTDSEDSITVHYIDHAQRKKSITAVGYAAKYDRQRYVVDMS